MSEAATLPIGHYAHTTWEDNGEQLHDWQPEVARSPIVAFNLERRYSIGGGGVYTLLWRREDGLVIAVEDVALLEGLRSLAVRRDLVDELAWASNGDFERKVRGAADAFGEIVISHYFRGNPFHARVWRP